MTKYEWEKELKRNLAKLPADEINRAIAFYDELFADKAEQGYSEREVVNEFGNPFDVANSIIRDYEAENGFARDPETPKYERKSEHPGANNFAPPPPQQNNYNNGYNNASRAGNAGQNRPQNSYNNNNNRNNNGYNARDMKRARRGGAAGALLRVLFFIPYMIFIIVAVSLIAAFGASALGCVAGGLVYIVASFTLISSSGAVFAVSFGLGFAAIAVGALCAILVPVLYKAAKGLSKTFFGIRQKYTNYRPEGY